MFYDTVLLYAQQHGTIVLINMLDNKVTCIILNSIFIVLSNIMTGVRKRQYFV